VTAFADALTVTTPSDAPVPAAPTAVRDVLDAAGVSLEYENEKGQLYRVGGTSGICRISSRNRVDIIYSSGQFLAHLRAQNLYVVFLSALSLNPHRVTRIDATLDVAVDAVPVLSVLTSRARAGAISLSRKRIKRRDVSQFLASAEYDPEILTGSTYVGDRKTAEVYLLAYDKRNERIVAGHPDPGPLLRYELVVRAAHGPTLRDAVDPTAMFYSFVSPDILARPDGVASWTPYAEGFTLEKFEPLSVTERLYRLLDSSPDVARLVKLAQELGPGGHRVLAASLERMANGKGPWVARNKEARTPALAPFTGAAAPGTQVVGSTGALAAPDRLQ
jgi:hypothetical protein